MFVLDKKLTHDTVYLGSLTLSHVLLMNQKRYPWVVLVPAVDNITELFELSLSERLLLMSELAHTSAAMKELYDADKMNVASLGNQTPQLHFHIIARNHNDPTWPEPVWADSIVEPYENDRIQQEAALIISNVIATYSD